MCVCLSARFSSIECGVKLDYSAEWIKPSPRNLFVLIHPPPPHPCCQTLTHLFSHLFDIFLEVTALHSYCAQRLWVQLEKGIKTPWHIFISLSNKRGTSSYNEKLQHRRACAIQFTQAAKFPPILLTRVLQEMYLCAFSSEKYFFYFPFMT